jgi:hypothetical protein
MDRFSIPARSRATTPSHRGAWGTAFLLLVAAACGGSSSHSSADSKASAGKHTSSTESGAGQNGESKGKPSKTNGKAKDGDSSDSGAQNFGDDGGGQTTTTLFVNKDGITIAAPPNKDEQEHEAQEGDNVDVAHYMRLYFFHGSSLRVVNRQVKEATVQDSVEELVKGPSAADRALGMSTLIPSGTTVRSVKMSGTTATVDLSSGFTSGDTSSATMRARVAEVVYTVTQITYIQHVVFAINGAKATALGSDHFKVDPPLGRADLTQTLDTLLTEVPAPGDKVAQPLHVFGMSNTFEGKVDVRLRDANGHVIVETETEATAGSGVWGTFDVLVNYPTPSTATGTLEVFDASQGDGGGSHGETIPVRFK